MEYCCHVWAGASQRSLSSLDSVQRRLRGLVGPDLYATLQPLSHRRYVASNFVSHYVKSVVNVPRSVRPVPRSVIRPVTRPVSVNHHVVPRCVTRPNHHVPRCAPRPISVN